MTLKQMFSFVASVLSLSAFAGPTWTGSQLDSDWWNVSNWYWGDGKTPPDAVSATFDVDGWKEPSVENWSIGSDASRATMNLGGQATAIPNVIRFQTSADYPVLLTNGTMTVGELDVRNGAELSVLRLADVALTASVIKLGELWDSSTAGLGKLVQESGSIECGDLWLVRTTSETGIFVQNGGQSHFNTVWCSYYGGGEGRIELNGGEMRIPGMGYVNWVDDSPLKNDTSSINMKLVMNGGTLTACTNSDGNYSWVGFFPKWLKVEVGAGGAAVDTNGTDIRMESTNIVVVANDGGFTKKGAGKLTLQSGLTWTGPTKVLGGTLDANGATITGPLVLGGDGKIVNATIQTTDITIQDGYVLSPYDFATVSAEGVVQMATLVAGAGTSSVSPVAGLIASAAGWYDPSDGDTLTTDENGGVTKIANKGSAGSMLDAEIVNDTGYITGQGHAGVELPYVGKLNGLDALVFTNNITGFQTPSHQFSDGSGKAVFAVSMKSDALVPEGAIESVGCVYPAEWCKGGWIWDTENFLGVASMDGWHHLRYKLDDEKGSLMDVDWGDTSVTDWPERQMFDQMIYVSSIRSTDRGAEGKSSVYSRADRYDNGTLKVANGASEAVALQQSENMESRICIGWSKAMKWHNEDVGNIPSVTAGYVGEILAFDRTVSDFESEIIHAYLGHKWISSDLPMPQAKLSIGTLTLDGGSVGFENSEVTVGNLVGAGAITDVAKVTVTGTITAKLAEEGAAVSVAAPLDLTGTALALDESELVLAEYGQTATVFTATSITGTPTVQLAEGDRRRIKVRNTGTAIVVERVNPGLMVIIR